MMWIIRIITVARRPAVRGCFLAVLVAWGVSGCAQRRCSRCDSGSCESEFNEGFILGTASDGPAEPRERWARRPDIRKLLEGIDSEDPAESVAGERRDRRYRPLLVVQCQCQAASSSVLGDLLQAESRLVYQNAPHHGARSRAAVIEAKLLMLRSVEERNQDAATALRLFYRLAQAEIGFDSLERSAALVDEALGHVANLRRQGLRIDVDRLQLEGQKLEILDSTVAVHDTIEQLGAQLRHLLADDHPRSVAYWPAASLTVDTTPIDEEKAVAIGLASRADIGMLRLMQQASGEESLGAVRIGLRQTDPLLGLSPPERRLGRVFASRGHAEELGVRQRQLAQMVDSTERQAESEIRQSVAHIRVSLSRIAIANRQLDNWIRRLDQLREQQATGAATAFDLIAAKVEVEKAQTDVIEKIVAWEIARVELAESQGLLAEQCGFSIDSESGLCGFCPQK